MMMMPLYADGVMDCVPGITGKRAHSVCCLRAYFVRSFVRACMCSCVCVPTPPPIRLSDDQGFASLSLPLLARNPVTGACDAAAAADASQMFF